MPERKLTALNELARLARKIKWNWMNVMNEIER